MAVPSGRNVRRRSRCPSCGLDAEQGHGTIRECVAALEAEVRDLRSLLARIAGSESARAAPRYAPDGERQEGGVRKGA
jgi:hypothetical protein